MPMDGPEIPDGTYPNDAIGVNLQITIPENMQRWEYKYIPFASLVTLNELGAVGWQMVLYLPPTNSFVLIRQILPESENESPEEEDMAGGMAGSRSI